MKQQFDFVMIGSGLGALVCADIISREGYSVCVLEKNRQFGGNLQIFSRDKCIFDTGVHYIGGLEKGQNLHAIFTYLGIMDKLKLHKLDEGCFDKIVFKTDKEEYEYAQGYADFYDKMVLHFPEEKEAIRKYCDDIKQITTEFPLYNLENASDFKYTSWALSVSVTDYLDSITANEKLKQVLAGTNTLYGGKQGITPMYVHALVIHSYIESSYKLVNGGAQIEKLLTKNIKSRGGVMRNYAEVRSFEYKDGLISCAVLQTGEKVYGDKFISNLHPAVTLDLLDDRLFRKAYKNRIKSLENSKSVFILNIALKSEAIPYQNYNTYYFSEENVWREGNYEYEKWPGEVAVFFPVSDKVISSGYAETMVVMAYMNFEDVQQWSHTERIIPNKKETRGASYEAFKEERKGRVLDFLATRYPDIRNQIQSVDVSTPLTFRDYIATPDGSMYGITKDASNPLKTFITPRTKIENLFLTGQNLNLHGILGVSISALVTCSEFFGKEYLLTKIHEANKA